MDALLSKTEQLSLEAKQNEEPQPDFMRIPAEIRNVIYEMCTTTKRSYVLQYPRASGTSDLLSPEVFHINHQTRDEALSMQYNGASITIQPRPGFYTSGLPRVLSRLPTDILKYCSNIEVWAEVKTPCSFIAWNNLVRVGFVVRDGVYHTEAWFYRAYHTELATTQVQELREYVDRLVEEMEELMLKALEGKQLQRAEDSPQINITLVKR